MSLQVWLPLNGNLNNQGLTNVTLDSGTPTYTNGKIGQCLSTGTLTFTVANNLIVSLGNSNIYSMCCWCKNLSTSTSSRWVFYIGGVGTGLMRGLWESNATTMRHWAYSGTGVNMSTNINTIDGQWHHICFTSNGATVKLYVDGIYQSQITNGKTDALTNNYIYLNATDYNLNDFRLYDHTLSQMEVKELSKGLVLHYPLNRNGWGQENLIPNSTTKVSSGYNVSNFTCTPNISVNEWGCTDAYRCTGSGGTSTIIGTISIGQASDSNLTYSYSIWVKNNHSTNKITFSTNHGGIYSEWLNPGQAKKLIVNGVPGNGSSYIQFNWRTNTVGEAFDFTYWHPKIEIGDKITPWCPNSTETLAITLDVNGTTEYDCSGFGNNGTRTGTFSWTSDTPKYNVSTQFSGSNYIKTLPGQFSWSNYDQLTVATWIKPTATPSSWTGSIGIAHEGSYTNKLFSISNYGGKFTVHYANNTDWSGMIQYNTLPLNEWHHIVATLSGTTVNMYLDGVLVKTGTVNWGASTNHASPQFQIGIDLPGGDEIYTGYYSDVRIYATALSADDVKSLYQNSAYIDSSGNVYGAIHMEA